jgi:perosamine synthetase
MTFKFPPRNALGPEEKNSISQVIKYYQKKKQDPGYEGIFEKKLCNKFSRMMGGGYADACSSGTAAAFIAISALNLKKGSEVLISPVTDSGPLNALILLGLKPKLIDSSPNSYNVSLKQFLGRVSKKTKAAVIMHIGGETSQIYEICMEAKKRKIKIIEDCSQAPFAKSIWSKKYYNKCKQSYTGSYGDLSFFSTMFSKTISSCGSAGIIYTKNKNLYHNILAHADRGKQVWKKNLNLKDPSKALYPALNFNTNEFSSAITYASLSRVKKTIKDRINFLKKINILLKKTKTCFIQYEKFDLFSPFYVSISVRINLLRVNKLKFVNELKKEEIPLLGSYGCVISEWKWAKKFLNDKFITKNAIDFKNKSFNLFLNENYSQREANFIFKKILKVEKKYLN